MVGLCEGGNEPPGSLKASIVQTCGLLLHYMMYNDVIMRLSYVEILHVDVIMSRSMTFLPRKKSILSRLRTSHNSDVLQQQIEHACGIVRNEFNGLCNVQRSLRRQAQVVVIKEDVQNVYLLLEYRPHIDVSLTCEHDPKLQEYCVCPQNMPQFDSEGIPNQVPETNKPMILNGPTSRNREGSDQVSVEAKQLGHLYLSIDQEIFDPSTGEPYD
ncbi:hypothetical protein ANN_14656 [Periplaneta americana]|uniref:Uncharacterized protein n=1 Tax=Periplaneta americana TaxID=6978 RepID=A0ABQ8SY06_PERAM|nr:hypothetical protein ANN_14656 [Periplaneta americana]